MIDLDSSLIGQLNKFAMDQNLPAFIQRICVQTTYLEMEARVKVEFLGCTKTGMAKLQPLEEFMRPRSLILMRYLVI